MKKRILTVLIAIITVIPLVFITPEASSTILKYDTVTTNYGSYSYTITKSTDQIEFGFEQWGFSIPFPEGSTITFEYNFNKAYSGRFDLLITNSTSWVWNTCYVMVDGGYFETPLPTKNTATTGKTFKIHVNNTDHIVITLISTASTLFNANTTLSISANYLTDGVELSDIDATLDTYIPGMSSSLANLYSGIGYDGNTSTSLNADTLAYDISIIKNYIDDLEGYVSNSNTYIDQLESYVDGLESQLTYLNQIAPFNFPNYQHSALYWGYAQVRGTSTHPTLEFWRGLPVFYLSTSDVNDGAFTQAKGIRVPALSTVVIYISSNRLFSDTLFTVYKSGNAEIDISYSANYDTVYQNIYNIITITNNSSSGPNYVELEPTASMYIMPYYIGSPNNVPDEVRALFGFEYDNTYTRLLQSINNAVGGEPYDTSQYDQYEQTMDGLNDSLRDRFNNVDDNMQTNIDTLFTPSGTAGSDGSIFEKFNFNGVNSLFTGILNGIFTSFPAFKYILLFALLLLVIGVMI